MKIACIDKTAADRVNLQKLFDDAFAESRNSVGHLQVVHSFPASQAEAIVNSPPDIFAVGPNFSVEDSYAACHALKAAHATTPIFVFLPTDSYSLRSLRRFQKVASEVFSDQEPGVRIVHKVSLVDLHAASQHHGSLILVEGVKGGVGSTSIATGLAHSAEALGKTALVIDLSPTAALLQYMGASRWQSSEYASLLLDGLTPDKHFAERVVTTAQNGIHLLLPPAGGSDIRERWLRDPRTFELSLQLIEILRDVFDMVIVDVANAEGILPFALSTRASSRLLVTSNDPASVHLLNSRLTATADAPGNACIQVVMNLIHEKLLTREDILDFLFLNEQFQSVMAISEPLPFDLTARHWVGTGNSFYTESQACTQRKLEELLRLSLLSSSELAKREQQPKSLLNSAMLNTAKLNTAKKLALIPSLFKRRAKAPVLSLPIPGGLPAPRQAESLQQPDKSEPIVKNKSFVVPVVTTTLEDSLSALRMDISKLPNENSAVPHELVMYEAPQRVVNGSE